MTKEEVAASLERMEDDPDDWCEECFYNRSRIWLTAVLKGTREFSALGVLVCNNKIWSFVTELTSIVRGAIEDERLLFRSQRLEDLQEGGEWWGSLRTVPLKKLSGC